MSKVIAVIFALVMAGLSVQSWRLNSAQEMIVRQRQSLAAQAVALSDKNSQLVGLSLLTRNASQEQVKLYAAAEQTAALLQQRQKQIERLIRENSQLRGWMATRLPAAVIRLRQRPAVTHGEDYRQWLSANNPMSATEKSAKHQRRSAH